MVRSAVAAVFLCAAAGADAAAEFPTGGRLPGPLRGLDTVVTAAMTRVGATAGSLAVARRSGPPAARTYGWRNAGRTRPVTAETTFRLGSNTKPFTAAAVRRLIRDTDLTEDTRVAAMLDVRPAGGEWGDPRTAEVTLGHLLAHRGGWDRGRTFDPVYRLDQIRREVRARPRLTGRHVVEYMFARPLQFEPGGPAVYSNFGYVLLGRVIEQQTGRIYEDAVTELIARPLNIEDLRLSARAPRRRHDSEVDYVGEDRRDIVPRDASSGLTSTPTSLCRFMAAYWTTGHPRQSWHRGRYFHYGSLPNTTMCWMVQRSDGVNWALMLNARRNDRYYADLETVHAEVDAVIDAAMAGGVDEPAAAAPNPGGGS